MQEIVAHDSHGNALTSLVQWDSDVCVYLSADEIDKAYRVHFFNNTMDESLVVESEYKDGVLKAKIPFILLQQPHIIIGYVVVVKDSETKNLYSFKINVRKKPVPSNYVFKDTKDWIEVESVINECRTYAESASKSAKDASGYATNAKSSAKESEDFSLWSKSYAIGEGGKRDNESTENAKYYYTQSKSNATNATKAAQEASQSEKNAKAHMDSASNSASNAKQSALASAESADKSEYILENIRDILKEANTIVDDVTKITYYIGIENGVVYISDEIK